ncbi:MAG: OmpA family protein [Bacteroidales bacterium]|nr:OmpA family protein [Bacteroidales bacterium]MCI6105161.1 OmpA family protein [Bacteroidales bacterium]MDY6032684.1 OmpA family protein [Alloprevotella sp.]
MKQSMSIMALGLAAFCFTGCVTKKQYAELQANNSTLQSQNAALQSELNDARVRIAEYTSDSKSLAARLAEEQQRNKEMREAYAKLQSSYQTNVQQGNVNISKLVDEINASNRFIKQLVEAKSKSDSLNTALSNKLTRSLTREEQQDVDVQVLKGVVYISLADNMLYKSGSYEIGDRAGETLSKIAKIITDYPDYDVLVEGNTDNVPIKRENIRNNWDLSTLRASSVVQALINDYGVEPKRLTAGGRGEFNPVASNLTEKGRQRNRRTQIIITPKLDQFLELIDQAPEEE